MLLAGCAANVSIEPPQTSAEVTDICLEMSRLLPEFVGDQVKRNAQPLDIRTAAWGDPPIVYRCGVSTPTGLQPTSVLASINGVDWFTEEYTDGYVFTTVKRPANIEVSVPKTYAPEATVLADLADLINSVDKAPN